MFLALMNPLVIFALLAALVSSAAIPPSQDAFYKPPAGYESTAPGTVLKTRPIPSPLRSVILPLMIKNTWQIMVRSTDTHGNPTYIVSTIIEPYNADTSKLVSFQIAEDAASDTCAVSYALEAGAPPLQTISSQAEMLIVVAILKKGWYVVTPDYEGPNSAFTVGVQAGQATLDSIRGALSSTVIPVSPKAKTILWGYSGGSIASGWAAALQPKYAPELINNLIGVAVGGFVGNVTATAEAVEGTIYAGLTAASLTGLTKAYPELATALANDLVPSKKAKFETALSSCTIPTILGFLGAHFFTGPTRYLQSGWDFVRTPTAKQVLEDQTLALSNDGNLPQIPVFIFQSRLDEIVPFVGVQRIYDNWCSWGIKSLEFATDQLNGHVTEFVFGQPAALAWVTKMFNGGNPVLGCSTTTRVSNIQYPGAPLSLAIALQAEIQGTLAGLGPGLPLTVGGW